MFLRHPRGTRLGAWFDGEGEERLGAHVLGCARCQKKVSELARVRAWVRAQPFFAMGEESPARPAPAPRRPRSLVVPALLGLLFVVLAPNGPWDSSRAPMDSAARVGEERSESPRAASPSQVPADVDADGTADMGDGLVGLDGEGTLAGPQPKGPPTPLRLGLIVPTKGLLAAEGAEVRNVVRRGVALANASGGVSGLRVELVVVPAEDTAAVAAIGRRVTALIGGFGAPPPAGVTWLLPADTAITGPDVLSAEAAPWAVGVRLARSLQDEGLRGLIGVVRGVGPDADLADGLASQAPAVTVSIGGDGSCNAEVASLRRSGVLALAAAGPPDLAARCLEAASRAGWHPRHGTLVAPSAVYAGVPPVADGGGPRTVLGLPWPTWDVPGAARFRATTQSSSYRALVSFAAAELAIEVARQAGEVSLPAMALGTWRSDLFDLVGTTSRTGAVVVAGLGSWAQVPRLPAPAQVDVPQLPPPPRLIGP